MIERLVRNIWGNLSSSEIKKYGLLSMIFFFIIGTYWLMRTLKDPIFRAIVGLDYQPIAKTVSFASVFFLVMVYSKLIDIVKRHKLFYLIGSFYMLCFLCIAFFLGHPTYGLSNTAQSKWRLLGWVTYLAIESFGSIMVALFWSFVISISDPRSAKRGYPLIITVAQFGSILGPFLTWNAKKLGLVWLSYLVVVGIACLLGAIRLFTGVMPPDEYEVKQGDQQKNTGFFEGLRLLVCQPYLFGIFSIVAMWEVVHTIIELQMKKQAELVPAYASAEGFAEFMGFVGICINSVAFLFALLGTSYLLRKIGLRICLLLFPSFLGVGLGIFYGFLSASFLSPQIMLWSIFIIVVFAKALSYALNNPSKEMLYLPTSEDAKYKTKGWIDIFGSRMAKGCGAQINNLLLSLGNGSAIFFLMRGSAVCLGFVGVWLLCASYLGKTFTKFTRAGKIIGEKNVKS